jgi:hypothetical protein
MEFEELKSQWSEMSANVDNQKKLTDKKISTMTEMSYRDKIRKIKISEVTGAIFCCVALIFILNGMNKLEPWYLMICGIVSVMMLILMPALSLSTLFKISSANISTNDYRQVLFDYNTRKINFINVQKLSICLGALLFVTILPVMGKLVSGKDLFKSATIWYIYSVGFPCLYYFATWVFKKYNSSLNKAEEILHDLKNV